MTMLLINPENMYHWLSLKITVEREISEDDPMEGKRVTEQVDRIWRKYIEQRPRLCAARPVDRTSGACCSSARSTGWRPSARP